VHSKKFAIKNETYSDVLDVKIAIIAKPWHNSHRT